MTETEKLEMIARIVAVQTDNQNDEEGDKYLSDAYLAMEAIECVLNGNLASGAFRTFESAI